MCLTFRAHAPEGRGDTIPLTVAVDEAAFEAGCPDLRIGDAHAVILAHGPELYFDGEHPLFIYWSSTSGTWDPTEFLVRVRLYNTGDREAENVTLRLDLDTAKLRFVTPDSSVYALPGGILDAGGWAEAVWKVMPSAAVRPVDSAFSCMTLYASNVRSHTCCCRIYFVDAPLGVEREAPRANTLQLWPNPGRGRLQLALPSALAGRALLVAADALGRVVLQREFDALPADLSGEESIDLSALPAGLYLLHLFGGGRQWQARYLLAK